MIFNTHSSITGQHAFLSPSSFAWIRYTDQKLEARWIASRAAARGTALHDLAHQAIRLGVKLSNADKTLAAYVRDAIGYKMSVEQPLYYSDNCFGHADSISFRRNTLRIFDLKTGSTRTSMNQLEVYAALFCLEYGVSPFDIDIELRIYQNEEIKTYIPNPEMIYGIMETIIDFDKRIEGFKDGGSDAY
jgi:RecB family exonuclease